MAKTVQFRRGNTTAANAFTGVVGQIFYVTDTGEVRMLDGVTPGGYRHLTITQNDARYFQSAEHIALAVNKQVQAHVGSVALPGYAFGGDTNTGIYAPAANQVAVATDGVQRLLINGLNFTVVTGSTFTLTSGVMTLTGTAIAMGAGSIDVSAGTLTLADNQIARAKVNLATPILLDTIAIASAHRDRLHVATAPRAYALQAANSVPDGWSTEIKNDGDFLVTVARNGADTIDGADTLVQIPAYTAYRFISNGNNKWYVPGRLPNRTVIQSVQGTNAVNATTANAVPSDDTIPQEGEGASIVAASAITPKSTSNRLRIHAEVVVSAAAVPVAVCGFLVLDGTANALKSVVETIISANSYTTITIDHEMDVPSVAALTFRLKAGALSAGTIAWNGLTSGRTLGGSLIASILVEELLAVAA